MNGVPKFKPDVQCKTMGNEVVVYDPVEEKFHFLNETAAFVAKACNGEQTADDIAKQLAAQYDVDEAKARQDVLATLENLKVQGLLEI